MKIELFAIKKKTNHQIVKCTWSRKELQADPNENFRCSVITEVIWELVSLTGEEQTFHWHVQEVTCCLEDQKSINERATFDVGLQDFWRYLGACRWKYGPVRCMKMPVSCCNCLNALRDKPLICNAWNGNMIKVKINKFYILMWQNFVIELFVLCSHIFCLTINSETILDWDFLLSSNSLP